MKKTAFCTILILAISTAVLVIPACSKTGSTNAGSTSTLNITTVLAGATNTSIMTQILQITGLDSTFVEAGPFTLLTPLDTAFSAAGINSGTINNYSAAYLKNLILYQTVAGQALYSTSFNPLTNNKVIMANGDSAFFTYLPSAGLFVNGTPITQADVTTSNGILDALFRPLVEQTGNLLQTINGDTSLAYFSAALARASQGTINLDSLLGAAGTFTVFAPSNAAFLATTNYNSLSAISSAVPDSIAALLSYQIIPGRTFLCNVTSGTKQSTLLEGYNFQYVASSGASQIQGQVNATPSNFLTYNRMASNGVLFSTDQVLQPY